jgi:hypothetical protein
LTELFNSTAIPSADAASVPETSKKRGWLPVLTVLFLISYGLMTMLIIEQGSTIESQRALIRELFRDSSELTKMKGQDKAAGAEQQAPVAKVQNSQTAVTRTPSSQTLLTQTPTTQTPLDQAPTTQSPYTRIPSTQADQTPSSQAAQQNSAKKQFRMPSKREPELIDDRRALITI